MSRKNIIAALEDFTEEVNSEIVADQPTDGDFGEETAGVNYPEESGAIDEDLNQITSAAQGLEDIISLVEEAPGETEQPMEPFVEKAVNVALESNDMVAEAGNPVNPEKDKTKGQVLEKIKAFAKKVWEMLRNFGKRIAAWIREIWAKFTDRIVKNAARAQKIIGIAASLSTKSDARITDKSLLAKIASVGNADVGDIIQNVDGWMNLQGGKGSSGKAMQLTKEARAVIESVASGASSSAAEMEKFLKVMADAAGEYDEDASPEQAKASGAAEGTKVHLSKPFFGGYRAWIAIPENAEELAKWNHGVSKVDEVKVADSLPAATAEEIKSTAEYIVEMGTLVKFYEHYLKDLDDLNKELDRAASKASDKAEGKQLKAMQAVIPRIIKGPQVASFGYATSASTVALQFCESSIRAHRGETTLGEKAGAAADKVGAAAAAAKDKVKSTFAKKAE